MVEGKIRRGIRKNEGKFFFLHNESHEIVGFSCLDWLLLYLVSITPIITLWQVMYSL